MTVAGAPRSRWFMYVGFTLAVLLIVPIAAWVWLRTSLPDYAGTVPVRGISARVQIVRDRYAVPHIHAASLSDALFALGFAHAQDRLFMLEYYRHQSQGRLAELIGRDGLESDIAVRLMNSELTAENVVPWQTGAEVQHLGAYVAGVNSYLDTRRGAPPPEFVYLGLTLRRWTVADALLLDNLTDGARTGWQSEAQLLLLKARLPAEVAEAVTRDFGEVPVSALRARGTSTTARIGQDAPAMHGAPSTPRSAASNSWAVVGRRSTTGSPLFAADPHLEFTLPSVFVPVKLVTPTLRFAGFVIPGIAWFVGHTATHHWGMTHSAEDMTDLAIEEEDETGTRYRTAEGWRAFGIQEQVLRVRGGADKRLRIRTTVRGPVISDHWPLARDAAKTLGPRRVLVLVGVDASDGSGGGRQYATNHELLLARTLSETDAALAKRLDVDNLIYADTAGNIAIRTAASVPVRRAGDGAVPRESWTDADSGRPTYQPISELPQATNPRGGCVYNANELLTGGPEHCAPPTGTSYRPQRLWDRLAASSQHSLDSFRDIQLDTVSLAARAMIPSMARWSSDDPVVRSALQVLRTWDGDSRIDSVGATLFHMWLREFDAAILEHWRERLGVELPHPSLQRYARMLTEGSVWCPSLTMPTADTRHTCGEIGALAFERSVAKLRQDAGDDIRTWVWGRFHVAVFEHPVFSRVPWLRWFGERRVPVPGGPETVNAANAGWGSGVQFLVKHGALTRRLEHVGHPDDNRISFAAGVSGNPLSRFYDDRLASWAAGEYFALEGAEDNGASARPQAQTLTLVPAAALRVSP